MNGTTAAPTPASPLMTHKMKGATVISTPIYNRLGVDDGVFWVNLLRDQMELKSGSEISKQQEHLVELSLGITTGGGHITMMEELSEEFDQTQYGTETLFALFDEDESGSLTHEEFHAGLKSQNLLHLDKDQQKFQELIQRVDRNNDGEISLEEFQISLERLRLARLHLLGRNMRLVTPKSSLHCVDYDKKRCLFQNPIQNELSFFFLPNHMKDILDGGGGDGGDANQSLHLETRWIHVSGHDNLTVLRLAVKHGLHKMAVLDALNLVSDLLTFPYIRTTVHASTIFHPRSTTRPNIIFVLFHSIKKHRCARNMEKSAVIGTKMCLSSAHNCDWRKDPGTLWIDFKRKKTP